MFVEPGAPCRPRAVLAGPTVPDRYPEASKKDRSSPSGLLPVRLFTTDPPRGVGQGRTGPTGPCQRGRDARHVLASLARQRKPDACRGRRSARSSCVTYVSRRGARHPKPLVKRVVMASRPVGGVLSAGRQAGTGGVAIHLRGLPGDIGRAARPTFGLAPGGVYQADWVTPAAGALLPHRFTLACARHAVPSAVCSLWHCPAGRPD